MARFLRRLRQRFCTHPDKRVWDINHLPDGMYRVRIYCPACGWREDVLRAPDEVVHDAAGDNPDMRATLRRNLNLEDEGADASPDDTAPGA